MRKTAQQQWDELPDLATPAERRWLDRWGRCAWRWGSGRYKIRDRVGPGDGQFRGVTVRLHREYRWVLRLGWMPITLAQIKAEVRRDRTRERRERAAEAERQVGAFI